MAYEAPISVLENVMGDPIGASQGGFIDTPDEDFQ